MRAVWLGLAASAAIAIPAAPAQALDPPAAAGTSGVSVHRGGGGHDGDFRHRHRHRGLGAVVLYDRDYQGDSAWRAESFNDWWHERPHRSLPRWMSINSNCERMWWSGGGWRC